MYLIFDCWRLLSSRWQRSKLLRGMSLVAIAVIVACTVIVPGLSQQPVTLTMLMPAPDVPVWNQTMVAEFEQANPNIKLQIVEGPNSVDMVENMYTTSFILGESPYDLINMDIIWTPKFAAAGWLMDLTDEFSQAELAPLSTVAVNGGRFQGRLYRLPVRSDAGMIYYRTDLLQQAGLPLPKTLEDLDRIAKTVQGQKLVRWGYLWQGRQYEGEAAMFVEVLHGFGGFWVNPDTLEVGLDRPEAIQAVNFLLNTIREGVSPPGVTTYVEEDTRRLFQAGDAMFMRNWPYAWPLLNSDTSKVKGRVGIMPMLGAAGQDSGSCLGGWGLGIVKTTRHKAAALKAIRFFTQAAGQKNFVIEAGFIPAVRSLFTDRDVVARYPHYPQLATLVDNAVLRPPVAQYAQVSDILQRYLSMALTRQRSPEAAMQAAAAETRRLLVTSQRVKDAA
ncbi:ABC transporter substrate-binding protein [Pantanalinema rosaneae CENA516]|uniref:ABC transporter substrate-binding protein n=1 Tax=Pantanalinema rosaneae TaxID=1620701 RepID=UPI003D7016D1